MSPALARALGREAPAGPAPANVVPVLGRAAPAGPAGGGHVAPGAGGRSSGEEPQDTLPAGDGAAAEAAARAQEAAAAADAATTAAAQARAEARRARAAAAEQGRSAKTATRVAARSARVVARADNRAARVVARANGRSTKVVAKAARRSEHYRSLAAGRLPTAASAARDAQAQDRAWRARAVVALIAAAVSVLATVLVYQLGLFGAGGDEFPHLLAARRVVDSSTPGFGQIGNYWPPLFHILELPFAMVGPLYRSGLAGTLPAMLAYVVGVVGAFELGRLLTGSRRAGMVAALAYGANPNLLYLQAVPMMESTIAATLVWSAASVARYQRTAATRDLRIAALWVLAATWAHYAAWLLPLWGVAVIVRTAHEHAMPTRRMRFHLYAFLLLACAGIGMWLLWGWYLQGDALYFARTGIGNIAAIQAGTQDLQQAVFWEGRPGNLAYAVLAFGGSMLAMLGPVAAVLVLAAGVVGLARGNLAHPAAATWVGGVFVVAVLVLLGGTVGSPLFAELSGLTTAIARTDNVRYALYLVPAVAAFAALAAGRRPVRQAVVAAGVVAGLGWFALTGVTALPRPDQLDRSGQVAAVGAMVAEHFDGGQILARSQGVGDAVAWWSGLDPSRYVTEVNGELFMAVQRDPGLVRWALVDDTALWGARDLERLDAAGFRTVATYGSRHTAIGTVALLRNSDASKGTLPADPDELPGGDAP